MAITGILWWVVYRSEALDISYEQVVAIVQRNSFIVMP